MKNAINSMGSNNKIAPPRDWRRKRFDKDLIFYSLMLLYPILQFIIFYIVVNANSISLAFKEYDSVLGKYSFSTQNFQDLWFDLTQTTKLLGMLKNSLILWFFTTVIGISLAVLFSYYIYKKHVGSTFFRIVLFLPSILPAVLLTIMFEFFVNDGLPGYLEYANITMKPLMNDFSEYRFQTALFYSIWIGFGTQVLLYVGAMEQISPSIIEAAKLDGASPLRELWSVVLPSIMPSVNTFIITAVANIFVNQANLFSFFGEKLAYQEMTIGYYLYMLVNSSASTSTYEIYPYASALGICCTLIAIPITFLLRWLLKKTEDF